MSKFERPWDLIPRHTMVDNTAELDIPTEPRANMPAQRYDVKRGQRVDIFSADTYRVGCFTARGIEMDETRGRVIVLENDLSGQSARLSDWQFAMLERDERLRMPGKPDRGKVPLSSQNLTPEQEFEAERMKGYVEAVIGQTWEEGKGEPTRGVYERAIKNWAAVSGETKPPSYPTVKKYFKARRTWPEIDIRAYLKPVSSGNTSERFGSKFEGVVKQVAILNRERGAPTFDNFMILLLQALELPENEDLLKVHVGDDGNWKVPHLDTMRRRWRALNKYDKTLLTFGPEAAAVDRRTRESRELPECALQIVEVDYVEANLMVFHDTLPMVYGRPKIIMFRDRKTGGVLGFSVFFGSECFEAFYVGLRMALYPKDMSRFPGLEWLIYGVPITILVDNGSSLISEAAVKFCAALRIHVLQGRAYRPTDKAGMEGYFHKQNLHVIHDLPGSVYSKPEDRAVFDDAKRKGIPAIYKSDFEAHLTRYICLDVNAKASTKFAKGGKSSNDLFIEDIRKIKGRDVVNPDEFVRIAGFEDEVAIQGDTITYNHIQYKSPYLIPLTDEVRHVDRQVGKVTTRYPMHLDVGDIYRLIVRNPYNRGKTIEVRASNKWIDYATGLTLSAHLAAVEYHNKVTKKQIKGPSDLQRARAYLTQENQDLLAKLDTKRAREKAAKFYDQQTQKHILGRVVRSPTSAAASASRLDPENPYSAPEVHTPGVGRPRPPESVADRVYAEDADGSFKKIDPLEDDVNAHNQHKEDTKPTRKPAQTPTHDDDIEALLARHKDYDK